jgi:2,4-dienoyl-CoA reductase-like NADH-dependent reductase (Old Yellow Enzyme family)
VLSKLFEPVSIGTMQVGSRFVRSATAERLSDERGRPLPELSEMYQALARGGVGLIVTGHAYIHPGGRCHVGMSGMYDDELIAPWSQVTAAAHEAGAKIAMQINHGGRQCDPEAIPGMMVAPSPIALNRDRPRPRELAESEIRALIRAFADAAGRAQEAGFDAVQLHGAHGYLISSFNSPASNYRNDAWGGTPSRRVRFLEEVAAAVRDVVGDDYPLFVKLGAVDFVRDGLSEDDGVEIIGHLADMGLDAVEISGGIGPGSQRAGIRNPDQVTDLPILLVGGIRSREVMERILDEGSADLISLCRPLIREPDLPHRLRNGQRAATCISCSQCWPREGELGISCHYAPSEPEEAG